MSKYKVGDLVTIDKYSMEKLGWGPDEWEEIHGKPPWKVIEIFDEGVSKCKSNGIILGHFLAKDSELRYFKEAKDEDLDSRDYFIKKLGG